jgi:hypothetical protein
MQLKPLESPDTFHLQAADGWLGPGDHIEAAVELEKRLCGRICGSKWPSRTIGPLVPDGTQGRTATPDAENGEFFALDHGSQQYPPEWDRVVTTCQRAFSALWRQRLPTDSAEEAEKITPHLWVLSRMFSSEE